MKKYFVSFFPLVIWCLSSSYAHAGWADNGRTLVFNNKGDSYTFRFDYGSGLVNGLSVDTDAAYFQFAFVSTTATNSTGFGAAFYYHDSGNLVDPLGGIGAWVGDSYYSYYGGATHDAIEGIYLFIVSTPDGRGATQNISTSTTPAPSDVSVADQVGTTFMVKLPFAEMSWNGVYPAPTSTLSVSSGGNGTVSVVEESGTPGAKSVLIASPSPGCEFSSWTVNDAGGGSLSSTSVTPATFTFGTSSATITANFRQIPQPPITCDVTWEIHYNSSPTQYCAVTIPISVDTSTMPYTYAVGDTCPLVFYSWPLPQDTHDWLYSFGNINSDSAYYRENGADLNYGNGGYYGTGTSTLPGFNIGYSVQGPTSFFFGVYPYPGGSSTANCNLIIPVNEITGTSVTKVFNVTESGAPNPAASTLILLSDGNGTVDDTIDSGARGTTSIITASPSPGYVFSSWTVQDAGGGSIDNVYDDTTTFTFGNANATVIASFVPQTTITGDSSTPNANINGQDSLGFVQEPVDTGTGAHVMSHSLLKARGAQDLEFVIDYDSICRFNDVVGQGWSHNFEASIQPLTNGTVKLNWNGKRFNIFSHQPDNSFILKCSDLPVVHDILTMDLESGIEVVGRGMVKIAYTLIEPSQRRLQFDDSGRLVEIDNPHGQRIQLLYPPNNSYPTQIVEIVSGKSLYLNYTNNLLTQVSDDLGRKTSFTYGTSNRLVQIAKSLGPVTQTNSFSYDSVGRILSETNAERVCVFTDTYDSQGRVATQRDALGNMTYFYYDESQTNRVYTTVVDRTGATNIYVHNALYQLLSITDPLGHTTSFGFDANGNKTAVTNALGQVQQFTYDSSGNVLSAMDAASNITWSVYDSYNNLVALTNAVGSVASFAYDANNDLTNTVDFMANQMSMIYDTNSQLNQTLSPRGGITTFTYVGGLLSSITDAATNTTIMGFDSIGRLIAVTNAAGFVSTNAYDLNDNLVAASDGLGNLWRYTYDSAGHKLTATDPLNNTTWYTYNGNGDLISQTNALGNTTVFTYDGEDRLSSVTDGNGHTRRLEYDLAGRLIHSIDALNHTNTFQYDNVGNLTATVDALGVTNQITTYDVRDQPITSQDALGNSKKMTYDALQRLIQTVDALSRTNGLNYDALGHLTNAIDPMLFASQQRFDSDGNRTAIINPKKAQFGFKFDLADRLTNSFTATGKTIIYTVDPRNLVTQIKQPSGANMLLAYDGAGRLTNSQDAAGTIVYGYDSKGRLLTLSENGQSVNRQYDVLDRLTNYTDSAGNVLQYAYDSVGNLTNLTYPDGKQVAYLYDAANRLTTIQDWDGRATMYFYDTDNRVTNVANANGTTVFYAYDLAGRVILQHDFDSKSNALHEVSYAYDSVGQIVGEANQPPTASFQPQTVGMSFDADNALATFAGQTVTNDANGNMIWGPLTPTNFSAYTYDVRNRLTEAGGLSYGYDPAGNRVAITNNGSVTRFVVNPNAALSQALMRVKNGVTNYYVYGVGLLYEVTPQQGTNHILTYHYDYRGSTVAITDNGGNVVDRISYSPYGNITFRSNTTDTPFLFNGRYGVQTDANGLLDMRARFYNPIVCRFVNSDPSQFSGGINSYSYANGNPVNFLDPFGLCSESSVVDNGWQSFTVDTGSYEYYLYSGEDWKGYAQAAFLDVGGIVGNAWDYFFAHHEEIGSIAVAQAFIQGGLAVAQTALAANTLRASAASVADKLERYLLNPGHPIGGPKAEWFKQALGFTRANASKLAKQLVFKDSEAVQTSVTQYGTKFNQTINVVGANGRTIPVTTVWIRGADGVAKLVTAVPGN